MAFEPVPFESLEAVMNDMGFFREDHVSHDTNEIVFKRQVASRTGVLFPFEIRVWSTYDTNGVMKMPMGSKISIQLHDELRDFKTVSGWGKKIFRTPDFPERLRDIIKEIFIEFFAADKCPKCEGLLKEITTPKGTFIGCSRYNPGHRNHCSYTAETT